eukprot:Skav212803  [mRNA]  locus=scaffold1633:188919:189716:- [translate_table: standard]
MPVSLGIDVAAYVDGQVHPMLATAAWMEFSAHVQELLEQGRRGSAVRLWKSVFEVVHLGSPSSGVLQHPDMPPLARVPCTTLPCQRCELRRGGFQFPWIGCWNRRAVLVQAEAPPAQAWERFHLRPEKLDLLLVNAYAAHVGKEAILPVHVAKLLARLGEDYDGYPLASVWSLIREWQLGQRLWREPWKVGTVAITCPPALRAGSLLRTLLGATEAAVPFIPPPCSLCQSPTWSFCLSCQGFICQDCNFMDYEECPLCAGSSCSD